MKCIGAAVLHNDADCCVWACLVRLYGFVLLSQCQHITGITPRFGQDIFDRLKNEKTIQVKDATVTTGPDGWTLTEEVRVVANVAQACAVLLMLAPQ